MHALVVLAHPSKTSFCSGICREACRALADAGHTVDCLDLYAEEFTAPMSLAEWRVFIDPARNQAGREDMVLRLKQAQIVITIAPVWLLSMPGVLKNWYDRVWMNRVAFVETQRGVRPGLVQIKHFIAISTYGAQRWQVLLLGNPVRRWSMRFHRAMCGWSANLHWWPFYFAHGDEARRQIFLQRLRKRLRALS